jgi:type I restriction enzyme S subunit
MKRTTAQNGWPLRRLGDVTTVMSGATPKTSIADCWNGDIVWLTPKDLGALAQVEVSTSERRITRLGFDSCAAQLIPPNSVVMSSRAPIGHLAINTVPACTNQGCKSFVPKSELTTRYLFWVLHAWMPQIQHLGDGSTFDEVSKNDLEAFEIPVPPLTEQRRLVERIEALSSRVGRAREDRQTALSEGDSLMTAAISGLFSNSGCWKSVRAAVSPKKGAVRNGPFGSQLLHHEFTKSGVAAIGTRDVQANRFDLRSGWFVSPEKFQQFHRYQVFPGDVLCTIVGASIGRFCVVPDDAPLAFTTKHIQALTLNPEVAVPGFVALMLGFHPRCRKSLFAQVDGSAQPSLNANKVLKTELPLPTISEQCRIVTQLEELAAKHAELRRLQTETEAELAAFTPALLAKAFKGEL